jgi:hypothetical protein
MFALRAQAARDGRAPTRSQFCNVFIEAKEFELRPA